MELLLFALGVAGFLAALRRLLYAGFRLLKGSVDAFLMREIAGARAQRGDVTGLMEAANRRRGARNARLFSLVSVICWLVLLIAPLVTNTGNRIYPLYTILWIQPLVQRLTRK